MLNINRRKYVWYVSYGSNMLEERFLCYIRGGLFIVNGRTYEGARDKTLPLAKMPFILPYNMYYANSSGSWGRKGVSFLDVSCSGKAYGVAYLITRDQFSDVCGQENGSRDRDIKKCTGWYDKIVNLGEWDGIEVVTLTNHGRRTSNSPSQEYLNVLKDGLHENYPYLTDCDIEEYLCFTA